MLQELKITEAVWVPDVLGVLRGLEVREIETERAITRIPGEGAGPGRQRTFNHTCIHKLVRVAVRCLV